MPFPDAPRVRYKKNQLDQVICQLRFPPILRIDTEVPVQFQESIRNDFPDFCEKQELSLLVSQKVQREAPGELLRQIMPTETKNYQFSSEDNCWTVNLTRTFVALTTKKYTRRSEFTQHLKTLLQVLVDVYKPACFSRVGLRYVDIIRRSVLNLTDVPWSELLQPYVLGLLSSSDVSQKIQTLEGKHDIRLVDETSIARIVTGLVECQEPKEQCFMIDTDFYTTQKTAIPDVESKLEFFHIRASRLIQWVITKRLHDAMEPETI